MAKKEIFFATFGNADPLTCDVYYQEGWLSNRLIVVWSINKDIDASNEKTSSIASLGIDASSTIYIETNDSIEYDIKHYVIGAAASYNGSEDLEWGVFNQFDAISNINQIDDEIKNATKLKNNSEDKSVFQIPYSYYKYTKNILGYVSVGTFGLFATKQFLSAEGSVDLALSVTNIL